MTYMNALSKKAFTMIKLLTHRPHRDVVISPKLPLNTVTLAIIAAFNTFLLTGVGVVQAQTAANISPDTHVYQPVLSLVDVGTAPVVMLDGTYAANAKIGQLNIEVKAAHLMADGVTPSTIMVTVLDRKGELLKDPVLLTIENSGGRLQMQGTATDEFGPSRKDADRLVPGTQLKVLDGTASFTLLAPSQPQDIKLRLTAGAAEVSGVVSYLPDLREMIAAGLIEGVIRMDKRSYSSSVVPARIDDGFEQELKQWSRKFGGDKTVSGRAAVFLKGKIKGDALLTMAYDSDKETRARLLRDIRPEEFYPIYGDGSIKNFEAQSTTKLYVRLDKNRSFLLYGDFNTGAEFSQSAGGGIVAGNNLRQLGAYNRTATGVKGHHEGKQGFINAFVSRDTLKQVTEELRANGTSGPFAINNTSALENSEKIEIVIRDRNNTNLIVSVTPLIRLNDYSFEPFSSRILLARAIPSVDVNGNPLSLRITYEVDQGGQAYIMAGADGQVNIGQTATVGAAVVQDKNPLAPFKMASVNAGIKLADKTTLIAEVAQTQTNNPSTTIITTPAVNTGAILPQTTGRAGRVELQHQGETLQGKAYINRTEANFANASGGAQAGTQQAGVQARVAINKAIGVNGELQRTQDMATDALRKNASVGVTYRTENGGLTLSGGIRRMDETGRVSGATSSIGANPDAGSYYANGSSGGFSGANSSTLVNVNNAGAVNSVAPNTANTPDLHATTLYLGAGLKLSERFSLNGQVEAGNNRGAGLTTSVRRFELMAAYQIAERARLYARYAQQTGLTSQYALDTADKSNAFSVGIDATYMEGGNVFSEYRLRDANNSREAQMATGLRNAWHWADGVTMTTGLERLKILKGTGQDATAATLGLDYTASELWKSSARLEWRRLDTSLTTPGVQDTLLYTFSAARKLDRNWTFLGRNYYLATKNHGLKPDGNQDRLQLGFAYRPVDTNDLDVLSKYEYKREHNINATDEQRRVHVAALQANWHPSRPLWVSTRLAFKNVAEVFPSTEGGGSDAYRAYLIGGRAIYDITENWDIGFMANVMNGKAKNQLGSSWQKALGAEVGYQMNSNLWLSLGYNWAGFSDKDLNSDYTAKGAYLRLRYKFDQDLFEGRNPLVNRSLPR